MNLQIVHEGLKPSSLSFERVEAFMELGIPAAVIADTVMSEPSAHGQRHIIGDHMEGLRSTVRTLITGGVVPERAAIYVQSRADTGENERATTLIKQGRTTEAVADARALVRSGRGRNPV